MEGELFQNKYRIKSTRLQGYDYSRDGYYFVTICTYKHIEFFGKIVNQKMVLSQIGKIAHYFWLNIPNHFQFVILDKFIIMPNHVHGIIIIDDIINFAIPVFPVPVGTEQCSVPTTGGQFIKNIMIMNLRGKRVFMTKLFVMNPHCALRDII